MTNTFKHPMNAIAKDIVSGFEGIIIARNAHLFGCSQYGLAPQELNVDGTTKRTEYFDEARIEIVDYSTSVKTEDDISKIFTVKLGTEVEDKVSGFKGKVLVGMEQLHNCSNMYVEPPIDKEGKPLDGQWFDEGRLTEVGKGISPEEVKAPKRGSVMNRDLPRMTR